MLAVRLQVLMAAVREAVREAAMIDFRALIDFSERRAALRSLGC
jgi:hypothetical protein